MLRINTLKKYLIFLTLLNAIGCANKPVEVNEESFVDYSIKDEWYKDGGNFRSQEPNELTSTHGFFDVDPQWDGRSLIVNYLPITAKNSRELYDLDLHSGKLFKVDNLCTQKDPWGSYKENVTYPDFTLALLPRTQVKGKSNELFSPQRLIVFHMDNEPAPKKDLSLKEFGKAKIVGSFNIEECVSYPCRNRESWQKETVLVGVSVKRQLIVDFEKSRFKNFEKLKDQPEWEKAKAFLQTQLGIHRVGKDDIYPRFRIMNERGAKETLQYLNEQVHFKSYSDVMGFRNSCRTKYVFVWNEIERIKKTADPREEFRKFAINLFSPKEKQEIQMCLKYVRPGHVNMEEPYKFWLFQFIRAAFILDEQGFYYNCAQKTWYPNPLNADSTYVYSTLKELNRCRGREVEAMFDAAVNGMGIMENHIGKSYRFVEYDTQSGGSHQKVYSWLPYSTKRLSCPNPKIELEDSFPVDIEWQEFRDGKAESIR